ncbi:dihydrofolate reductase [Acinetobacter qingfengensis]|uniref:Dihydrofolate reductase n=1 Tax=Acinetobacter qingfengensis TaxID=1262585 RepID=A0A1E7RDW7_9GAMM|nr:dihydrofolate reductase [Acinetobacter qingfengensis]KAA8734517.1 dihydrofolate reductase [Acinetobacter qingfengensis]OEY97554.1 diacylglycerol kinase [Acinetobacter qingfengensis]
MAFNNIEVVHVVAFDQHYCIGKNNQMAWHISEDFKHFKEITQGGIIIMGRKTFESIGRPLPNRINWVITHDHQWQHDGVKVAHSIEDALQEASFDLDEVEKQSLFIIGGGEIFTQTLAITDRLEITHVDLNIQGDAFYPAISKEFVLTQFSDHISEKTQIAFRFAQYLRQDNFC